MRKTEKNGRGGDRCGKRKKEKKHWIGTENIYIYIYTYDKKIWSEKGERLKDKRLRMAANGIQRKRIAFFSWTCKTVWGEGEGKSETTDHVAPRFGTYPDRLCKFSLHREVRGFSDTDGKTGHALHVYGFEFELSGWMPSQSNPCLWVSLNSTFHNITWSTKRGR